jgi:type II secretory pathway pseudopilin PulG
MRNQPGRRSGFTLVELLVAAAVSILLMVILTEAFKAGLEMFRRMRAQGNLMTRLREASVTIRDDLTAAHFPNDQAPNQPLLSQQDLTSAPAPGSTTGGWTPPTTGYFRIIQGPEPENLALPAQYRNNPFVFEGLDPEGIMYCRCTNHIMQFTVYRGASGPDDMFRTLEAQHPPVGNNVFPRDWIRPIDYLTPNTFPTFSSRWAQVSYFMKSNGDRTKPTTYNPTGLPLFDLCRRVQLLVPLVANTQDGVAPPLTPQPPYPNDNPDISAAQNHTRLVRSGWNTAVGGNFNPVPPSVDQPRFRFGVQPGSQAGFPYLVQDPPGSVRRRPPTIQEEYNIPYQQARFGDDVLLSDVLSFEIKALWDVRPPGSSAAATAPSKGGTGQNDWFLPGVQGLPPDGSFPNTDTPFDFLPTPRRAVGPVLVTNPSFNVGGGLSYRVFDTWSRASGFPYNDPGGNWNSIVGPQVIPLKIRIKALQIRIRVFDRKSEQSRQITIVQDM